MCGARACSLCSFKKSYDFFFNFNLIINLVLNEHTGPLFLKCIGYSVGWSTRRSQKPPGPERLFLSLCYALHCWLCWRVPPAAINTFCELVKLCKPPPHQDWGRARTAGSRFARDDKNWDPSWGKQLSGGRPRETAETQHASHQPSRHVRGKSTTPLSGAEEQTARACLLSLQMGIMN